MSAQSPAPTNPNEEDIRNCASQPLDSSVPLSVKSQISQNPIPIHHGDNKLHFPEHHTTRHKRKLRDRIILGLKELRNQKAVEASTTAVKIALTGNVINTLGKFLAFFWTGSNSMLSEALHSTADVANQALLLIGVKRSQRPPTQEHPYGFEGERFVYALISATSIFFLGACFSIYHGVYHILHPGELDNLYWAVMSLSTSASIESVSFSRGVIAVRKGAAENGMTFFEYMKKGTDPMGVAVVMEDGAALLGLMVAASSLGLSYYTDNTLYDACGCVVIGSLLAYIAIFLIAKNARSLSTRSVPPQKRARIIKLLKQDPIVLSLHDVKALQIGVEAISFSASIEFDGETVAKNFLEKNPHILAEFVSQKDSAPNIEKLLISYGTQIVEYLGDEVDRLENQLKTEVPEIKFVDLESN